MKKEQLIDLEIRFHHCWTNNVAAEWGVQRDVFIRRLKVDILRDFAKKKI